MGRVMGGFPCTSTLYTKKPPCGGSYGKSSADDLHDFPVVTDHNGCEAGSKSLGAADSSGESGAVSHADAVALSVNGEGAGGGSGHSRFRVPLHYTPQRPAWDHTPRSSRSSGVNRSSSSRRFWVLSSSPSTFSSYLLKSPIATSNSHVRLLRT